MLPMLAEWEKAKNLAMVFWRAVALDGRISPGFQASAQDNLQTLQGL
ncbi:MAG: hypothetical protein WA147_03435 [Polaromonas sp.]